MGGGRLPRSQALSSILLALGVFASLAAAACFFGGDDDDPPTPAPTSPFPQPSNTPPEPTPTPDPLAILPVDQREAVSWLQVAFPAGFDPPCPRTVVELGVACAQGDADGDGYADLAYLVPLKQHVPIAPYPAALLVRRAATGSLEPLGGTADISAIGASVFAFNDRTGDGRGDLTYLENECSSTACKTRAIVMVWDGNAWRNIGPGGDPIGNVDSVAWIGAGASSKLVIHGGKLPPGAPALAGPTRSATSTFVFGGARYTLESFVPDPPDYLYHAILDADRIFQSDKQGSIAAFRAALDDAELKDWRSPAAPDKDRRPALQGFALFRIALAHAAIQSDPRQLTSALDDVVNHGVDNKEPLFATIATEFRRGYANGGLPSACAAVLAYINKEEPGTDNRAYIAEAFSYGYENEPGSAWIDKICPF